MKIDFVQVAWGQTYTDFFLEYSLPSMLSPNNLCAWPYGESSRFVIYTTHEDQLRMAAHPALQRCGQLMAVEYRIIPHPKDEDKYHYMGKWNSHSFDAAHERGAGVVILNPDALFSDGSFAHLAGLIAAGRDFVVLCSYHVTQEEILPVLKRDPVSQALTLSIQDCWDYINRFMHTGMMLRFIDEAPLLHQWPSHIYHRLEDGSIQANCYHMHPIYLRTPKPGVDFSTMPITRSFDGDYMNLHYDERENAEIICDTSMIQFNWVPWEPIEKEGKDYPLHLREMIRLRFENNKVSPIHRYFYQHPVILKEPSP